MSDKKVGGGSSNGGGVGGRVPATELLKMVTGGAKTPQQEAFYRQEQQIFHPATTMHFVSDPNQLEISNNLDSQLLYPGAAYSWLSDPMNSYWCQGFQLNYLNSFSNGKVWNWNDSNSGSFGSTSLAMQFESTNPGYKDHTYVDLVSHCSSLEVAKVPACTFLTPPSNAVCVNHLRDVEREQRADISEDSNNSRVRDPLLMLFPTTDSRNTNYDASKSMVCDDDVKYIGLVLLLQKELSKSDVGNVGRIVLPKVSYSRVSVCLSALIPGECYLTEIASSGVGHLLREAEANLPALFDREGMTLFMNDLAFQTTWKFRYRFWPNNKSRMYILECTGDFVRTHGLQSGDSFILYQNATSGDFIVRGKKLMSSSTIKGVEIRQRPRIPMEAHSTF